MGELQRYRACRDYLGPIAERAAKRVFGTGFTDPTPSGVVLVAVMGIDNFDGSICRDISSSWRHSSPVRPARVRIEKMCSIEIYGTHNCWNVEH